jgi:Txe/YoeB family toxin of Txe-Axe toxin-antitoxin module
MPQTAEIIKEINEKTLKLISAYQRLNQNYQRLEKENELLKSELKLKQEEISKVLNQNKTIKIAKSLEGNDDNSAQLKLKINEIVREVDRCMALLNK